MVLIKHNNHYSYEFVMSYTVTMYITDHFALICFTATRNNTSLSHFPMTTKAMFKFACFNIHPNRSPHTDQQHFPRSTSYSPFKGVCLHSKTCSVNIQ